MSELAKSGYCQTDFEIEYVPQVTVTSDQARVGLRQFGNSRSGPCRSGVNAAGIRVIYAAAVTKTQYSPKPSITEKSDMGAKTK